MGDARNFGLREFVEAEKMIRADSQAPPVFNHPGGHPDGGVIE